MYIRCIHTEEISFTSYSSCRLGRQNGQFSKGTYMYVLTSHSNNAPKSSIPFLYRLLYFLSSPLQILLLPYDVTAWLYNHAKVKHQEGQRWFFYCYTQLPLNVVSHKTTRSGPTPHPCYQRLTPLPLAHHGGSLPPLLVSFFCHCWRPGNQEQRNHWPASRVPRFLLKAGTRLLTSKKIRTCAFIDTSSYGQASSHALLEHVLYHTWTFIS